jgi:hypothetical protein
MLENLGNWKTIEDVGYVEEWLDATGTSLSTSVAASSMGTMDCATRSHDKEPNLRNRIIIYHRGIQAIRYCLAKGVSILNCRSGSQSSLLSFPRS